MSSAPGLVLLLCAMGAARCRETPRAKAAELRQIVATRKQQLAQRVAKADANRDTRTAVAKWIMPPKLREISGLVLTSRGTVLAHDDNAGRVYEIDPKSGVLLKGFSLMGNQKEDFEAVAIAGNDIYLMASDGKLFRFREGADGQQVQFIMFDTGLGKACEFEGLDRVLHHTWRMATPGRVRVAIGAPLHLTGEDYETLAKTVENAVRAL